MKLNYIQSQSSIKPELVDSTSSKKYTYLRKDVVESKQTDDITNETVIFYNYLEAKLTKEEYELYLKELSIVDIQQQRADIDYIIIMMDLDHSAIAMTDLDGTSANFDKIKQYYDTGLWDKARLHNVVGKASGITADEYEVITGNKY